MLLGTLADRRNGEEGSRAKQAAAVYGERLSDARQRYAQHAPGRACQGPSHRHRRRAPGGRLARRSGCCPSCLHGHHLSSIFDAGFVAATSLKFHRTLCLENVQAPHRSHSRPGDRHRPRRRRCCQDAGRHGRTRTAAVHSRWQCVKAALLSARNVSWYKQSTLRHRPVAAAWLRSIVS